MRRPSLDTYEKVGYLCLALVAGLWLAGMVLGIIVAFPFGLIGLVVLIGVGALLVKVIKERLASQEDDYYDKNVQR